CEIQGIASERGTEILLPVDSVAARELTAEAVTQLIDARNITRGWIGLDIGPKTVELFRERIASARTIVWTGPMGAFEFAPFADGTRAIGEAIAASDAYSVIGGGETGEAAVQLGVDTGVSFISTGGGACLALLRGKPLPALDVLLAT
ncbi:phosphoglycerate kinase, partial [Candidatus Bipolaricaulota bacterium]|nr:phosphoglycerate kinase [Candidatus Bipolaricaulota bacterium]